MGWSVTDRGSIQVLDSAPNIVVPAFTPNASKTLFGWALGFCSPTSVTGHGTWSQLGSTLVWDTGALGVIQLWACKSSGAPGSSTVTFNHAANFHRAAGVVELDENVAGMDAVIANCFGTPVGMSQYTDGSSPHLLGVTLAPFANASNLTLVIGAGDSGGGTTFTGKTGSWVLPAGQLAGASGVQGALAYLTTADTAAGINSSANFSFAAAMAIEVKMAAAVAQAALMPQACY